MTHLDSLFVKMQKQCLKVNVKSTLKRSTITNTRSFRAACMAKMGRTPLDVHCIKLVCWKGSFRPITLSLSVM